jgi:hypothetical protein
MHAVMKVLWYRTVRDFACYGGGSSSINTTCICISSLVVSYYCFHLTICFRNQDRRGFYFLFIFPLIMVLLVDSLSFPFSPSFRNQAVCSAIWIPVEMGLDVLTTANEPSLNQRSKRLCKPLWSRGPLLLIPTLLWWSWEREACRLTISHASCYRIFQRTLCSFGVFGAM